MQENQGIKPATWGIIAVIVVIIIGLGFYMFGGSNTAAPTTTGTDQSDTSGTAASVNRIIVSDQFPGNVVYVSSVQLAAPGWVVIYTDAAGTPGKIIGQQWFAKGINPGKVNLTQSTVEGGTYYAVLANESGDSAFDATKDLPLKDAAGNVIMKIFHATSAAAEIKG
jgi:hypothetical protein